MAKSHSRDLRERLALAFLPGRFRREVARTFDAGARCVIKLMRRDAATGGCRPRRLGGDKRFALAVA